MSKHSKIGASSAYRWFECPGSVRLSDQAPPGEDSIYAQQGTAAHWVIEQYYKEPCTLPEALIGAEAPNGYVITEEDVEAIREFIDFISEEQATGKFILHSEAHFVLDKIYPGLFGTCDIALMESNMKRLRVIDYKHGSGIPVEVVNNKQLMYYALGAIQYVSDKHKIDYLDVLGWGSTFTEVEIIVVQPRCRHKDGAVRRYVVPADALNAFAIELKKKAKETTDSKAPFKTGDHCRFCPAISICKEFSNMTMAVAKTDFKPVSHPSNLKFPDPDQLSKDEIKKILDFADLIVEFLKRVEGQALHMMEHGELIPGYKLVKKKANRDWVNEEEAKDALLLYVPEDSLFKKKFVSPAQAEGLFKTKKEGKKIVEDLCFKPDAGSTLAPEHDPREAISGSAVSDFETADSLI